MNSSKNIYWIVSVLSFAGYAWVGFHFFTTESHTTQFSVCVFKNLTGLPCISCGITRSVVEILHGHLLRALFINPLGFLALLMLIIMPVWTFYDFIKKTETLATSFKKGEALLRTQKVYLPLIALGLLNWYWNILKGL